MSSRRRRRVVDAADAARSQIERDLHDGAQQRLVALGVHLRLLASRTDGGARPDDLAEYIEMLTNEVDLAIDELRELAHGIYPPLLEARGLVEAFGAVARRSPMQIVIEADGNERFDRSIESALYFTGLEALANTAKHAPDAAVRLTLTRNDSTVVLSIADTGPGFDADALDGATGLFNMRDRMEAVGGSCSITTEPGTGTVVVAEVPAP